MHVIGSLHHGRDGLWKGIRSNSLTAMQGSRLHDESRMMECHGRQRVTPHNGVPATQRISRRCRHSAHRNNKCCILVEAPASVTPSWEQGWAGFASGTDTSGRSLRRPRLGCVLLHVTLARLSLAQNWPTHPPTHPSLSSFFFPSKANANLANSKCKSPFLHFQKHRSAQLDHKRHVCQNMLAFLMIATNHSAMRQR